MQLTGTNNAGDGPSVYHSIRNNIILLCACKGAQTYSAELVLLSVREADLQAIVPGARVPATPKVPKVFLR